MIEINNLNTLQGDFILRIPHLCFKQNNFHLLRGKNGTGKSLFFKTLVGLIKPQKGEILINGKNIINMKPHLRDIAMVFQEDNLFSYLTVEKNISLYSQSGSQKINPDVICAQLKIEQYLSRKVSQLSQGQAKVVALACCIIQDRSIIALDEPFASISPDKRKQLGNWVVNFAREWKKTLLVISHFPEEMEEMADNVVFF